MNENPCSNHEIQVRFEQGFVELCRVELVKVLSVHRHSFDIFSCCGLSSDGRHGRNNCCCAALIW